MASAYTSVAHIPVEFDEPLVRPASQSVAQYRRLGRRLGIAALGSLIFVAGVGAASQLPSPAWVASLIAW